MTPATLNSNTGFLKVSFFTIILVACLYSTCYTHAQTIELNEKGLFLNSTQITTNSSSDDIEMILGKPNKKSNLANLIWTYKKIGLYFHFDPESNKIKQLTVCFAKEDFPFAPSKLFTGTLKIYNDTIANEGDCDLLRGNSQIKFDSRDLAFDKNHPDLYISLQHNISWGSYSSVSLGLK